MSSARQRFVFWAALLLVSLHFSLAYISETRPFLDLPAFAAGRTDLPFQSRALTGWLLRGASHINGRQLDLVLQRAFPASGGQASEWNLLLFLIAFVSMVAAILCTRASLVFLTQSRSFASVSCFLVAIMAYFNYILSPDARFLLPYDLPSLAFFCAGLYLILSKQLTWYYPVFILACLNRETAVFLALFFAVLEWPRKHRVPWLHVAPQVILWTGVKLWLQHLYASNPVEEGSGLFDVKLLQNLGFLAKPQHWPTLLSNFAFTFPFVLYLRDRISHEGLRKCLPILGLWFAAMMVVGVIIEIRIFGELISYMSLVVSLLVWKRLENGINRAQSGP